MQRWVEMWGTRDFLLTDETGACWSRGKVKLNKHLNTIISTYSLVDYFIFVNTNITEIYNMSKSLSLQKFYKSIEAEIRNYWQISTGLIYAERWWQTVSEDTWPTVITKYPGDNHTPFSSIVLSPKKYIENIPVTIQLTRESAIVGFITAFEVYMLDLVRRLIYLDPMVIDESQMPFEAKEISKVLGKEDFREWFSSKVADKYMRNKTHLKMILRIQAILKYDLKKSKGDLIEEWNKWTYVRNAIVHNGREVSEDLHREWPEKFTRISAPLALLDKDLIRVQYLAVELAKLIDSIAITNIIKQQDAVLLIREIFIRFGTEDSKQLKRDINAILNHKIKTPDIDKALAFQRRTNAETRGYTFSHYNFQA